MSTGNPPVGRRRSARNARRILLRGRPRTVRPSSDRALGSTSPTGTGRPRAAEIACNCGDPKIKRVLWYCPPTKQRPAGSVRGRSGDAVRYRGGPGDEREQDGLHGEWAMSDRGPAGRGWTSRPPAARRRWNGAASGMLAGALEAMDTDQCALGRNPSGDNGMEGLLATRALRSVRTARGGHSGARTIRGLGLRNSSVLYG